MKHRILPAIPVILVIGSLLIGIWMLVSGIGGAREQARLKEEYETVEGYFTDYSVYSEGGYNHARRRYTGPTYRLTYTYTVGGMEYTVSTDYGTGLIPEYGTPRTVYYDPNHPDTAVLGGTDSYTVRIIAGVLFTGIPLVFILGFCYVMDWLPKLKIDIMDLIVGTVMAVIGGGFLLLMEPGVRFHPMMLIPALMIAAGLFVAIRGIFSPGGKK